MSIPGIPPPSDLQSAYAALQMAIASGVRVVRFQDRTVEYATVDEMIKAANYIAGMLNASGQGTGPGTGSVYGTGYRQIRFVTGKGL